MKFKKRWIFWGLLFLSLGYNLYGGIFMNIKTETASNCTVSDIIETDGFAVRDETIINISDMEKVSYKVSDGEKVARGGVIANIYENDQDEVMDDEICKIEDEIKMLKKLKLMLKCDIKGPDKLASNINREINDLGNQVIIKDYTQIYVLRKKIKELIDQRRISMGKQDNFDKKIKCLEDKKNSLQKTMSKCKSEISSPSDGYFVSFIDGYENSVSYGDIKHLNIYGLGINQTSCNEVDKSKVCKLVNSGDWYIICRVPIGDALRMKKGNTYELRLPLSNSSTISGEIFGIKYFNENDMDVVIKCDCFNRDICKFRKGKIKIKVKDYYGAKIDKKALCYKNPNGFKNNINLGDLEVGVNVKCGNMINFKKISILYSSDSYIVCSLEQDYGKNSLFLRSGDQIVVEGTNLYTGKLIKC